MRLRDDDGVAQGWGPEEDAENLRFLNDSYRHKILGTPGQLRAPTHGRFKAVSADYLAERRRIEARHGAEDDGVPVL